jgi:hypothetical protein
MSNKTLLFNGKKFRVRKDDEFDEFSLNETYKSTLKKLFPEKKWIFKKENDWQGEWFAVGIDDSGYYFHQGCFGSCSGCDMLLGIDTKQKAIEFLTLMNRITPIGKTKDEAISYLKQTRENTWDEGKEVIDEVIKQLEDII